MIATAVNYSGFEHSVIKTGVAHDLFRFPLRLVIRRTAVWTRAQETHQHDSLHAGRFGRQDHVSRSLQMNAFVSLVTDLAIDTGAVGHCITAGKRARELVQIVETAQDDILGARTTRESNDLVSLGGEPRRQMTTDKT